MSRMLWSVSLTSFMALHFSPILAQQSTTFLEEHANASEMVIHRLCILRILTSMPSETHYDKHRQKRPPRFQEDMSLPEIEEMHLQPSFPECSLFSLFENHTTDPVFSIEKSLCKHTFSILSDGSATELSAFVRET